MLSAKQKTMIKGAGVLFALLVFKPSIPISLANKVQGMFGGGAS